MHLRNPTALLDARSHLLPAVHTGVKKPLGSITIGQQKLIRLFAEGAVTRLHRNRHKQIPFLTGLLIEDHTLNWCLQLLDSAINCSQTISDSVSNLRDASMAQTQAGRRNTRSSSVDRMVEGNSVKPRIFVLPSSGAQDGRRMNGCQYRRMAWDILKLAPAPSHSKVRPQ
jgi:hypothetical protein